MRLPPAPMCWALAALLPLLAVACLPSEQQISDNQLVTVGQRVYARQCAQCHGAEGQGLAQLYPPLQGSDYLANRAAVVCAIRHGLQGPLVVSGQTYNAVMPPHTPAQLPEADLVAVVSYVQRRWGTGPVATPAEVQAALKGCGK